MSVLRMGLLWVSLGACIEVGPLPTPVGPAPEPEGFPHSPRTEAIPWGAGIPHRELGDGIASESLCLFDGCSKALDEPQSSSAGEVVRLPGIEPFDNGWDFVPGTEYAPVHQVWSSATNDAWGISQRRVWHFDGADWRAVFRMPGDGFGWYLGLSGLDAKNVWFAGSDDSRALIVDHFDGQSIRRVLTLPEHKDGQDIASSPQSIAVSDSGEVFVAADIYRERRSDGGKVLEVLRTDHVLLHWDGHAWHEHDGYGERVRDLVVDSSSTVWAVDKLGRIAQWSASQGGWLLRLEPGECLNSLLAFSSNDVWALGEGAIERWDGSSWSRSQIPNWRGRGTTNGVPLNQPCSTRMWGSSPDDVWIGANEGLMHHYDGFGWSNFEVFPEKTAHNFRRYWLSFGGSSASDIWAVSQHGAQLHFDGESWKEQYPRHTLSVTHRDGFGRLWVVDQHRGVRRLDKGQWTDVVPTESWLNMRFHAVDDGGLLGVGYEQTTAGYRSFVRYWDEFDNHVELPPIDSNADVLTVGADARSHNDMWVAAQIDYEPMLARWDGTHWHVESIDGAAAVIDVGISVDGGVYVVVRTPAGDRALWRRGEANWIPIFQGGEPNQRLVVDERRHLWTNTYGNNTFMHFDGVSWETIELPDDLVSYDFYYWEAHGGKLAIPRRSSHILHWSGSQWSQVPSPAFENPLAHVDAQGVLLNTGFSLLQQK